MSQQLLNSINKLNNSLNKIILDIGKSQGIIKLSGGSRGTGIRFIDQYLSPTAKCLVCGKGLLDRKHVDEHRKTCNYNPKDYDKLIDKLTMEVNN